MHVLLDKIMLAQMHKTPQLLLPLEPAVWPTTCMPTVRFLGPSSSTSMTDCLCQHTGSDNSNTSKRQKHAATVKVSVVSE